MPLTTAPPITDFLLALPPWRRAELVHDLPAELLATLATLWERKRQLRLLPPDDAQREATAILAEEERLLDNAIALAEGEAV